jgi:hypothetical protein
MSSAIERSTNRSLTPELRTAPDELAPLIPLTPVHYWFWLMVVALVTVGIVVWSIFSTVPLTVERSGILTHRSQQPEAITYVDAERANTVQLGQPAQVILKMTGERFSGQVTRVALAAADAEQAAAVTGDNIVGDEPIYEIRIALNSAVFTEGTPCEISILTGEMRPISRALPIFS